MSRMGIGDFISGLPSSVGRLVLGPLHGAVTEKTNRLWASQTRSWPVTIDLEEDVRIIWANTPPWVAFGAFIPEIEDPHHLQPPSGSALDLYHWAVTEHGGLPSGFSTVRLDIRSRAPVEVIFDSVRVHCEEFDPGPGISVIQPVGGASLESRRFDIKLSAWAPEAQALELGSQPVQEFAATISKNDPLRINLDAQPAHEVTLAKGLRWWVDVDFLIEGMRKSVRVPKDPENSFTLVNNALYPQFYRTGGSWEQWDLPTWRHDGS